MYRKILISIMLIAVMAFCSCATLKELIKPPEVTFQNLTFSDMSLFDGTLVFIFKVSNPNPVGATIDKLSYNLKINNNEFINGVLDKGINLSPGGSRNVELPVRVNYLEMFESIKGFIESDDVNYDLSGAFTIGPFDVPYHTKGDFRVPDLPEISLRSVEVSDLSISGASLNFKLEMSNSNPFAVAINSLNYDINLAGTEFADGQSTTIQNIGGSDKSIMEIPLNVNFFQLGQSAYNLLTGDSSDYKITGEMKFNVPKMGQKSFPFQRVGTVPLR